MFFLNRKNDFVAYLYELLERRNFFTPNTKCQLSFGLKMKTIKISGEATGGSCVRKTAKTFFWLNVLKFRFELLKPNFVMNKKGWNIFFLKPTKKLQN